MHGSIKAPSMNYQEVKVSKKLASTIHQKQFGFTSLLSVNLSKKAHD